jgi:hypothetical protein
MDFSTYKPLNYGEYEHPDILYDAMRSSEVEDTLIHFELDEHLSHFRNELQKFVELFDSNKNDERLIAVVEFKKLELEMQLVALDGIRNSSYARYCGVKTNSNVNWLIDNSYDKLKARLERELEEEIEYLRDCFKNYGSIDSHVPGELYTQTNQFEKDYGPAETPEEIRRQEHEYQWSMLLSAEQLSEKALEEERKANYYLNDYYPFG